MCTSVGKLNYFKSKTLISLGNQFEIRSQEDVHINLRGTATSLLVILNNVNRKFYNVTIEGSDIIGKKCPFEVNVVGVNCTATPISVNVPLYGLCHGMLIPWARESGTLNINFPIISSQISGNCLIDTLIIDDFNYRK